MKKIVLLSLCLILTVSGFGCKKKEEEPQAADVVAEVSNPIKELDSPDFKKAGFRVAEYPREYELTRCAEIDGAVGEMNFDLTKGEMTLRVSKQTADDISGYYITFHDPVTVDVDGTAVTIRRAADDKGMAVCSWDKDGYTFSLAFEGIEDEALPETASAGFVSTVVMDPVSI